MPTIYVVDDDADTRNAIGVLLQCEGYDVRTFPSACDFLGARTLDAVDCILTDIEMPGGLTGLDLLSEVSKSRPNCPVVVMTGSGAGAFKTAARALGASDYLEKPFSADHLIRAISRATMPALGASAAE